MSDFVTRAREVWNTVFNWKVKGAAYTLFVCLIVLGGFQYQVDALNQERFKSMCEVRVEGRNDVRDILLKIVDISDLFQTGKEPSDGALRYIETRQILINERLPELSPKDC